MAGSRYCLQLICNSWLLRFCDIHVVPEGKLCYTRSSNRLAGWTAPNHRLSFKQRTEDGVFKDIKVRFQWREIVTASQGRRFKYGGGECRRRGWWLIGEQTVCYLCGWLRKLGGCAFADVTTPKDVNWPADVLRSDCKEKREVDWQEGENNLLKSGKNCGHLKDPI